MCRPARIVLNVWATHRTVDCPVCGTLNWLTSRVRRLDSLRYIAGIRTVSYLVRVLSVILVAFALSSLLVYRLRLARTLRPPVESLPANRLVEETRTIEGEIQSFDADSKTFTLMSDG